jgi:effector-binding domain-containing protein
MEYQVQMKRVDPQLTAVVRTRAAQSQLSKVVPQLCGEVWTYAKSAGLPRPGRHVATYFDDAINLEVGALVDQPFTGNERVVCSSTPAGLVAMTEHVGPYDRLDGAHKAIRDWCAAHGQSSAGPNWEIYGHWNDDPNQLITEVYYLLQGGDKSGG